MIAWFSLLFVGSLAFSSPAPNYRLIVTELSKGAYIVPRFTCSASSPYYWQSRNPGFIMSFTLKSGLVADTGGITFFKSKLRTCSELDQFLALLKVKVGVEIDVRRINPAVGYDIRVTTQLFFDDTYDDYACKYNLIFDGTSRIFEKWYTSRPPRKEIKNMEDCLTALSSFGVILGTPPYHW